jgi:aspartate aminotransferase
LLLLGLLDEFPQLNIINDAVYDHIHRANVKRPVSIFALANSEQRKRVFEVNSLAKSYAYPAIRSGWAVGDGSIIASMQELKDPMLGPLNNIAQLVAISALAHTEPNYHDRVNKIYDERLKLVHDKLHKITGFGTRIPDGAFYYFADFSGVKHINVNEIVKKLADRNIKVASGTKFGAPNCIRINCGANEKILSAICNAIVDICRS